MCKYQSEPMIYNSVSQYLLHFTNIFSETGVTAEDLEDNLYAEIGVASDKTANYNFQLNAKITYTKENTYEYSEDDYEVMTTIT